MCMCMLRWVYGCVCGYMCQWMSLCICGSMMVCINNSRHVHILLYVYAYMSVYDYVYTYIDTHILVCDSTYLGTYAGVYLYEVACLKWFLQKCLHSLYVLLHIYVSVSTFSSGSVNDVNMCKNNSNWFSESRQKS